MGFWITGPADEKDQAAKEPAITLELPPDIWSRDSWPSGEKQLTQAAGIFCKNQSTKENHVPKENSFALFLSKNPAVNTPKRNVIIEIEGMIYAASCVCSSRNYKNHNSDDEDLILTVPKDDMKYIRYIGCWANEPHSGLGRPYKDWCSLSELHKRALKNSRKRIARNTSHRNSPRTPGIFIAV